MIRFKSFLSFHSPPKQCNYFLNIHVQKKLLYKNVEESFQELKSTLGGSASTNRQFFEINNDIDHGLHGIPEFHKLLETKRGYPNGIDSGKCYELLWSAYEHARFTKHFEELQLLKNTEIDPRNILQRLRSADPSRYEWYSTAKIGDIDIKHHSNYYDMAMVNQIGYDMSKFHSFSNAPYIPILFDCGNDRDIQDQTNIFVGFCDLGTLANSMVFPNNNINPTKFICIDMSPYSVAKSHVIYEMLKDKNISNESVLEIWYSSTWTKQTRIDFAKTVQNIILSDKYDPNIMFFKYINHWYNSKGVNIKQARKLWMESLTKTYQQIATFKHEEDMLDFVEYTISGDMIRESMQSICGNITMFDNIKECPKKAKDESVYHVLNLDEIFLSNYQRNSLKKTTKLILLNNIKKLKNSILSNQIIIEFLNDKVTLDNDILINKLKNMNPNSVVWSNCIDYFHHASFHRIAKEIGYNNCVHYAYSMNWPCAIKGSHIMDYQHNHKQTTLEHSKKNIKDSWEKSGIDKILRFPPIDNGINYGSTSTIYMMQTKWIEWFLSKYIANTDVIFDKRSIIRDSYNPLHSVNTIVNFHWSYDPKLLNYNIS
eukprot:553938_1